jgi:hypothetical protein
MICVGLAFCIGFGITSVILFCRGNEGCFATIFGVLVGIVIYFTGYSDYTARVRTNELQQEVQQQQLQIEMAESHWTKAKEQEYSFYIDGSEVDPENINKDFYKVEYDDSARKVFMTKRG